MIGNEDDLATEPFPAQEPWEHQIAALEQELRETASELEKTRALLQRAQPGSANPLTWKECEALAQGEPVEDPRLKEAPALLDQMRAVVHDTEGGRFNDTRLTVNTRQRKGYRQMRDLLLSRAPAQSAAPTPDPNACWHCHTALAPLPRPQCENCLDECDVEGCPAPGCTGEQPAAPEPSADLFGEDAALAGLQAASEAALATELDELRQACLGHQSDALAALQRAESAEAQLTAVRDIVNDIPESVFTAAEVGMLDEGDAIEAVGDLRIIRALLTTAPSPGAGEKT